MIFIKLTKDFFMQHGVKIRKLHAYIGRSTDQKIMEQVDKHEQKIILCGAGSHHQGDISEVSVKNHTLRASSSLL